MEGQGKKVIVYGVLTYNDRYEVLAKTLSTLLNCETIICHNGCKQPILFYTTNNIILNDNIGSSGGYKAIIEYFETKYTDNDCLVLLDDDNCLSDSFHENLKKYINPDLKLAGCYRASRSRNRLEYFHKSYRYFDEDNYFGLNIFRQKREYSNYLGVVPFGGMVLSHGFIKDIGLPKESYFVYGDDIEYSLRAKKLNQRISFFEDCLIVDQFSSTSHTEKRHRYFQESLSNELLHFQLTNHRSLSYITKSSYKFYVNKFLFILKIMWDALSSKTTVKQFLFVLNRII